MATLAIGPVTEGAGTPAASLWAVNAAMADTAGNSVDHFCHACFSGRYAIPFSPTSKRQMRLVGV